jgi:hypothetical protein
MNDELGEVKAMIAATEADLTEAERERKVDLVLMYGNLLPELKPVFRQVRYITIEAYAIFCGFSPPHVHDIILPNIYLYVPVLIPHSH